MNEPESLAKLTVSLAIIVALVIAVAVIYTNYVMPLVVMVNGDVVIKGRINSHTVEYAFSIRQSSKPLISYVDPVLPLVKYPLISFDDSGTVANGFPLTACEMYVRALNDRVIATYVCKNSSVVKIVLPKASTISIVSRNLSSVSLNVFPNVLLSYNYTSKGLVISALLPYLNASYQLSLGVSGCEIGSVRKTPWNELVVNLVNKTGASCKFKIEKLRICFGGVTEFKEDSCAPSPFYSRLLGSLIYGLANVIAISLMPIVAWLIWRRIKNDLRGLKGVAYYVVLMSFLGSVTALHWDAIMSYYFSQLAFNPVKLYEWTFVNQLLVKTKIASHYPLFAGYTYIAPWIAFFLAPISVALKLFSPKGFLFVPNYDAVLLGAYPLWVFRVDYQLYYFVLGLWFGLFLIGIYYIGKKVFKEEDVLCFIYSPLTALITFYWKMFEPMLLLLFVVLLYMVSKRRHFLLSGLLGGIVTTKVYGAIYLLPFLKYLKRKEVFLALLGLLLSFVPTLIVIRNLGIDRFIFITLYYQSHREIAAVNYYPITLGEPVNVIASYGNLAMVIELALFAFLFIKMIKGKGISGLREYLLWSISLIVPYIIFNKIVSPQNYLFLLFALYAVGYRELANLLSILLTSYVAFVFPTVFYFALSLMTFLDKFYFTAKGSLFSIIAYFFETIIRPFAWSVLMASIIVTDAIALMRALEELGEERSLGMRSGS